VQAARAGLEASDHLLEGAAGTGLLDLLGPAGCIARLAEPSSWRGETLDQVYLKPFPGCRHVHPAVEAALGLRSKLPTDPSRWSQLTIRTYDVALGFATMPRPGAELYDCLMSLPWCVALALLQGTPDLAAVTGDRARPALWGLAQRVVSRPDPSFQADYPSSLGATVEVTLDDGRVLQQDAVLRYAESGRTYSPAGPFGPVLDEAGVIDKFMSLGAAAHLPAGGRALARRILGGEEGLPDRTDARAAKAGRDRAAAGR
jgi:2-methylcitrate dehydratase PrpD